MPDPYQAGMFKKNPYAKKIPVTGRLVVILEGKLEGRGLKLINPISRALCKEQIHELIITDEADAGPGAEVNRIAYLGFLVIEDGGVVVAGDEVSVNGIKVGEIAGFDDTHMPNHWNIILRSTSRQSGIELGFKLGGQVIIQQNQAD